MAGTQRYWDGSDWTDHVSPASVLPPVHENMTGGYALAVLLPIVGLIYGLVKWSVGGQPVVVASIVAAILWAMILGGS